MVKNWHTLIHEFSPVEHIGKIQIKREDKFAPMGYGKINGSKLRVCIWLIHQAIANGAKGVIHGAVTGSPQHPMVAAICNHYGIPCVDVVGSSDIDSHPNLVSARLMGAQFVFSNVGYAKTLEATAYRLQKEKYKDYFVLETNITVNEGRNSPQRIKDFHSVGAHQVGNIPDDVDTVILPAGSCNSAIGALYGIAETPRNIRRVVLMGIGNYGSKDPDFIRRRLDLLGVDGIYQWPWNTPGSLFSSQGYIEVEHHDLNGSGYCEYSDLMPYTYEGVVMHPRYEGKIWNYMDSKPEVFKKYMNPSTMFWVVGGVVTL